MKALLFSHSNDEAAVLSVILQQAGFSVRSVRDAERTVQEWNETLPDFTLLTLVGDEAKTLSLVKHIRSGTSAPLLVLAEQQTEEALVNLYEAGVDLVVLRPYSVRVLLAQIRNLMRRSANVPFLSLPLLTQGEVVLDPAHRTVQVGDNPAQHLTQLEFRLLYTLMTHPGQVIPTESLVEYVWGYSGESSRDLVRGLVQRLRGKLESKERKPHYILNESGVGYFFNRYPED